MPTHPFVLRLVSCLMIMSSYLVSMPLQGRAATVPSGPKFVLYSASTVGSDVLPPVNELKGFNVVNLAFLQYDGAHDQAENWAKLSVSQRQKLKEEYNDAGIALLVTAFGADDLPATAGHDPVATAESMAQFVQGNQLDGIDVDFEEVQLMQTKAGAGETWVSSFTQTLRVYLPKGRFIISHAPVGPWFEPKFCPGGGYLTVHKKVGDLIDWYNVQYYNQSPSPGYEDCNTLLRDAGGSSVFEIRASGIPAEKIVIGKPGDVQDTTNGGFMEPTALGSCVAQAVAGGWQGGVMVYQYPRGNATWLSEATKDSFNQ
uniref:Lmo1883 protein n=1 Tax=Ganoderma boninense TaxID=34458 RepID=A0A5K1JTN1_9APHY|nr:Lmo1883 protein [Ganoderma boninense]